jgi:hypothetical protein
VKWKIATAVWLRHCDGAVVGSVGRQRALAKGVLSANDYLEIQQLVASYPYAFDTRAENGEALGKLFTPDGVFVYRARTIEGREKLAAFVRGDSPQQGPFVRPHFYHERRHSAIGCWRDRKGVRGVDRWLQSCYNTRRSDCVC